MLYQLSYTPTWWAFRDSNPEPTGYEPAALTIELKAQTGNFMIETPPHPCSGVSLQLPL